MDKIMAVNFEDRKEFILSVEDIVNSVEEYSDLKMEIQDMCVAIESGETALDFLTNKINTETIIDRVDIELLSTTLGVSIEDNDLVTMTGGGFNKGTSVKKDGFIKKLIDALKLMYKKLVVFLRKFIIKAIGVLNLNSSRIIALINKTYAIDDPKDVKVSDGGESLRKLIKEPINNGLFRLLGSRGVNTMSLTNLDNYLSEDNLSIVNKNILVEYKDVIFNAASKFSGGVILSKDVNGMLESLATMLHKYKSKNNIFALFNKEVKNLDKNTTEDSVVYLLTGLKKGGYKCLMVSIPKQTFTGDNITINEFVTLLNKFKIEIKIIPYGDSKDVKIKEITLKQTMTDIKFNGKTMHEILIDVGKNNTPQAVSKMFRTNQETYLNTIIKSIDEVENIVKEVEKLKIDDNIKEGLKPIVKYLNTYISTVGLDSIILYVDINKCLLTITKAYVDNFK